MDVTQVVITRTPDGGGFKVTEMGPGESGRGETLRSHNLPQISADMTARYLAEVLHRLMANGGLE